MRKEKIYIFDTTLRDGAQTEGVDFTIEDKNKIAKVLSDIGVDYIEGGWPGANPVDTKFFSKPPKMHKTQLTAFGIIKNSYLMPNIFLTDTKLTLNMQFLVLNKHMITEQDG